ncbi:hypothetical protein BJX63DRAFT_414498 [Aspergillus granulosus]|uniref:C2H2-type domain-containing protein n=1 Tax=Aspergillus granulosus TaxID=176169 RepID=A0ABR4GVQ7_9EURO
MQRDPDHPDFLLLPSQFTKSAKMMAVESSRQHHAAYFPDYSVDPSLVESFNYVVDSLGGYGQHDTGMTQQAFQTTGFADSYTEMPKSNGFPLMPITPPAMPISNAEFFSGVSTASGPSIASASSSAMGSPYSANQHNFQDDWVDTHHGLGLQTAVMGSDLFSSEYTVNPFESDGLFIKKSDDYVDPSLIQPMQQSHLTPPAISYPDQTDYTLSHTGLFPQSPEPSQFPHTESYMLKHSFSQQSNLLPPSPSTMPSGPLSRPVSIYDRRSSISSIHSRPSQASPAASSTELDEDTKEKGRCPHPDCGRVFKDLKAHMLTHQSERPEKCPIVTCEYHTKGFARKYDKNRHTLTHYKGTMVCGFCPGSGSPAEKSFNRADVFKRHLTSVHGVEQTPPNCRKRSPAASSKSVSDYCQDATGKCSTCSGTFSNAQDFYEHLDDCVLRVVQQEEPSEAINQQRLAEVDADEEVKKTMEKHKLFDTAGSVDRYDDENDDDDDDFDDRRPAKGSSKAGKGSSRVILGTNNAVTKHSSNANNKGGRITASKRRNNRDRYPQSWGCPSANIKTKKRVLCVFDGQRRLWKDEMMLDNEFEVRLKLPAGAGDGTNREAYITDLDVETLKRADGILNATEEERGAWIDGPSSQLIGQPAMLLPDFPRAHEGEVDIDGFMS